MTSAFAFAVSETGLIKCRHRPAHACRSQTRSSESSNPSRSSCLDAANSAGLAVTWRASSSSPPPSLSFAFVGHPSLIPRFSAPSPVSRCRSAHSQASDLPRETSLALVAGSGGCPGMNRASTKPWEGFKNRKRTMPTRQKKVTNVTPEIFNTLRVICPPITRSRFSATCTEYCKHPETFSTLSCDLATRLFTCLPLGLGVPGHRISCPDIDTAIKSRWHMRCGSDLTADNTGLVANSRGDRLFEASDREPSQLEAGSPDQVMAVYSHGLRCGSPHAPSWIFPPK